MTRSRWPRSRPSSASGTARTTTSGARLRPQSRCAGSRTARSVGQPVALVLASHRMADLLGTELLGRAHELHPTAKRGLLISWGDRSTAEPMLQAMAVGQFDYYVPKPSAPPDEGFHSIVEGFLADWAKLHGRGFTPIVLVGDPSATRVHELPDPAHPQRSPPSDPHTGLGRGSRPVRTRRHRPRWSARRVRSRSAAVDRPVDRGGRRRLGCQRRRIARRVRRRCRGRAPLDEVPPSYGASEGLRTLVVEREALGGQAGTSSLIRQLPGVFPTGVSGSELAVRPTSRPGYSAPSSTSCTKSPCSIPARSVTSSSCRTGPRSRPAPSSSPPGPPIDGWVSRPSTVSSALACFTGRPSSKHQPSPGRELRRRRWQLRRTGRPPPRQVRQPGHPSRTRSEVGRDHVRVPDHPDHRHPQHRHQDQHRSRRRQRRPAPPTTHAARHPRTDQDEAHDAGGACSS